MKKTRINPISKKRQGILAREQVIADKLLEECRGFCMLCGKRSPLEKNHTKDRKLFIMSCRECHEWHSPGGRHRYLDALLPNQEWGREASNE